MKYSVLLHIAFKRYAPLFISALIFGCSQKNPLEISESMKVFKERTQPENCSAHVYFFLQPDCPLSQNYTLPLASLAKDERFQDFCFTAFFSGKLYKHDEFEEFILHYETPYQIKLDPELEMAKSLGATVVPEVFVINQDKKILYEGAIDDWAVREGGKGREAKVNYLEEALLAVAENRKPEISKTQAVGCILQ